MARGCAGASLDALSTAADYERARTIGVDLTVEF